MVKLLSSSLAALALLTAIVSAGMPVQLASPQPELIGTPAQGSSTPQLSNATADKHLMIGTPAQSPHLSDATAEKPNLIGTPAQTPHLSTDTADHFEHIGTPAQIPSHRLNSRIERRRTHHHSSSKVVTGGKVTFYGGSQLLNPACPGAATPNDGSMIAAISFDSPFQCGDKIMIKDPSGKHAVVTAVDRCAGCTRDWIDVTKGVFRIFDGLETGVLRGVTLTKM